MKERKPGIGDLCTWKEDTCVYYIILSIIHLKFLKYEVKERDRERKNAFVIGGLIYEPSYMTICKDERFLVKG